MADGGRGGPRPGAGAGPAARAADLPRPPGRGVGRGRRPGGLRPGGPTRSAGPAGPRRSRRDHRPVRRAGRGPLPARRLDRGGGRRRRRCSTRWCSAPTASAPPTRPWAGSRSEGIAVDAAGTVHDLTMRSFGILPARDMPPVTVSCSAGGHRIRRPSVNGSDAVFAAVAAARWLADGLLAQWPTDRAGDRWPGRPGGASQVRVDRPEAPRRGPHSGQRACSRLRSGSRISTPRARARPVPAWPVLSPAHPGRSRMR